MPALDVVYLYWKTTMTPTAAVAHISSIHSQKEKKNRNNKSWRYQQALNESRGEGLKKKTQALLLAKQQGHFSQQLTSGAWEPLSFSSAQSISCWLWNWTGGKQHLPTWKGCKAARYSVTPSSVTNASCHKLGLSQTFWHY